MADLKISQLSSATALAGTEVVPVVQGGSTKKATIDQILAPASGKGINFAAAGGDTLTIYDEGNWTPTLTVASGSVTLNATYTKAVYTRVGRQVTLSGLIYVDSVSTPSGQTYIGGLPFSPTAAGVQFRAPAAIAPSNMAATATTEIIGFALDGYGRIYLAKFAAGVQSDIGADIQANTTFVFSITFMV